MTGETEVVSTDMIDEMTEAEGLQVSRLDIIF